MKYLISLFLSRTLIYSCSIKESPPTEYILPPNEVVLNITWKGTYLYVCTRDTVTNIVYFRCKGDYSGSLNKITFK